MLAWPSKEQCTILKKFSPLIFSLFNKQNMFFSGTYFAEGFSKDLPKVIIQKINVPENQIQFIALKLVQALGHLHNNEICFRNLTTESILVTE